MNTFIQHAQHTYNDRATKLFIVIWITIIDDNDSLPKCHCFSRGHIFFFVKKKTLFIYATKSTDSIPINLSKLSDIKSVNFSITTPIRDIRDVKRIQNYFQIINEIKWKTEKEIE